MFSQESLVHMKLRFLGMDFCVTFAGIAVQLDIHGGLRARPRGGSAPLRIRRPRPVGAPASQAGASATPSSSDSDPLKRQLTPEQKKKNSKALKQELSDTYKKWLNEDVRYIITPEEMAAFKQLSNDEERDQFIEHFWLRRDPTPDTPEENEFKEEHYRRIAYANEHFRRGHSRDGGPIAGAFISSGDRPTRSRIASLRRHVRPAVGRGRRHT